MNCTIPEALLAIADEVVRMELLRCAPQKCERCTPERKCWFCRNFHAQVAFRKGEA